MKKLLGLIFVIALCVVGPVRGEESRKAADALAAANAWLKILDSADYAKTWKLSAGLFQSAVTQNDWEVAARRARTPFGAFKSRKVISKTFARSLPGAPDGEYVVIQYQSRFARKQSAVETVTPLLEKDGSWKVSGYYIK